MNCRVGLLGMILKVWMGWMECLEAVPRVRVLKDENYLLQLKDRMRLSGLTSIPLNLSRSLHLTSARCPFSFHLKGPTNRSRSSQTLSFQINGVRLPRRFLHNQPLRRSLSRPNLGSLHRRLPRCSRTRGPSNRGWTDRIRDRHRGLPSRKTRS